MSKLILSLIMPVYNGRAYIETAIRSYLEQFVDGIELIVINDGSTDGTQKLIISLFSEHIEAGHIVFLTQSNQGISSARNNGLSKARGQYIGFIDADDILLPGFIQSILREASRGVDIIEYGYKTFTQGTLEISSSKTHYVNKAFGVREVGQIFDDLCAVSRWYPWARVFHAKLFEEVQFPEGIYFCEDLMTVPSLYKKAKKISSLPAALYGYRTNFSSVTYNVKPNYVENLEGFYGTVPRDGRIAHDYLRIGIAYSIYSCRAKMGRYGIGNPLISADMKKLKWHWRIYLDIDLRRILILLFPGFHRLIFLVKMALK